MTWIKWASKWALFLTLVGLCLTCGSDKPPRLVYVRVLLSQLPSDTKALSVVVTIDGVPQRQSPYKLEPPVSDFWVELDPGSAGLLSIALEGTQAAGCLASNSRWERQIAGEPYLEANLAMTVLPAALCKVTLRVNGDGRAVSSPTGLDCRQECSTTFAIGQPVAITATPDRPTAQYVWSGACRGAAGCQFTVAGPETINVDFTPRVCTQDASKTFKWCWENPLIQGNALWDVWVAADGTVFAVGGSGTIIRWSGGLWGLMDSGTTADLYGVWGSSADDVWATGVGGVMLHYQGGRWGAVRNDTAKTLRGLSGAAANDIWGVGDDGTVVHWDGTQWALINASVTDTLNAAWASTAGDAWAVGDNGTALRWNGTSWARQTTGTATTLSGVWASGPNDAWVSGDGAVLHWTGSSFVSGGNFSGRTMGRTVGTGVNNVYVTGRYGAIDRWNGLAWTTIPASDTGNVVAIAANAPSNVWAVGTNGTIVRFDGSGWVRETKGVAGDYVNFRSGWAASATDAWVTSGRDFMVASEFMFHWDGLQWQSVSLPDPSKRVYAMWGTGADNVWGVGENIVQWTGSQWVQRSNPVTNRLVAIAGSGPNDIWALSVAAQVIRWNGSGWSVMPGTPAGPLRGLAVVDNEAWITSSAGTVHHWTGAGWTVENVGVADELASIVAADRSNIAVASQGNAVYRWNGSTWTKQTVPGANSIRGLALGSSVEVWCAHDQGVSRYDGVTWNLLDVGTRNFLAGIMGVPSDYWVYGQGGTILHYRR